MTREYLEDLHGMFNASNEARSLFERVAGAPARSRQDVLTDMEKLRKTVGLTYTLLALYRQQVNSGFVLADPLKTEGKHSKEFFDPDTGITFRLQWNPLRELRKDHALLVERNVVAENVDETRLINRRGDGKACYLCKTNIDVQNPGEILFEIDLAGEKFYAGANFAYMANNHFTIMNAEHCPQRYRKETPTVLNDFVCKTEGYFRAIFNGRAGASIEWHEHIQATTEHFPIEQIRIDGKHVVHESKEIRISHPFYYIPVWVIEGRNKGSVELVTDRIVEIWQELNQNDHTENIIAAGSGARYRTFVILRDRNKLAASKSGKKGAMAAFETGGNIILSCSAGSRRNELDEKHTFDNAGLDTVKQLLKEISPDRRSCLHLLDKVSANICA
ncbi:MAG TPA: DUF4922 domain-containing protein [Sedimentisphaerales bacterium]|nr:DUF4922 domain-containing protein [Sedimentisphaerales bacterium]